jgi:hypothetical protein
MNGSPQSTALPRARARFAPVILSVAVVLSLSFADASRSHAAAASYSGAEAGFWSGVGSTGREYRPSSRRVRSPGVRQHRAPQAERAPDRTVRQSQRLRNPVPYGSSGYVAPVLPQAEPLTARPVVQPYQPPPTTTFSDRVNNAIQAYPLQKGIGNNPVDQQEFIRQRANQP